MVRTLQVTTPLQHGRDVRLLQTLLDHNPYGRFLHGAPIDSRYGVLTASAVRRAKFALGYRRAQIDGTADSRLVAYLNDHRKLSVSMRARRRRRLRKSRGQRLRMRVVALAAQQVGVEESPAGSNDVLYSRWYGLRGPWCAMFVSWVFTRCGRDLHYAYVPYMVSDARAGKHGLTVVSVPRFGDVVCFDWDNDGVADHVGIVTHWQGGTFRTIEGNTSVGNDSNGGAVMRRERHVSQVQVFVRVHP